MKTNYDREIAIYLDTINELSTALDNKEKENQTKAATTAIMLSFNIKLIGEKDDKLEQLRNKLMEIEFILIEAGGELLLEHISLLGQCCMGYIPANKIGSISSKLSQFNFDVEIIESHQWVN